MCLFRQVPPLARIARRRRAPLACAVLLAVALGSPPLGAQRVPVRTPPHGEPRREQSARSVGERGAPPRDTTIRGRSTAPPPVTTAFLQGVALDSLRGGALAGALIHVEGTGRFGSSDSLGRFLVDSIPPGAHRVIVDHPMVDTLGIMLVTPPLQFEANSVTRTIVAVPGADFLVNLFCPAARRTLGPGAMVGRVREPDSDSAAVGARVSFVWYDPDPPGLPAALRPTRRTPRVREATVGADGTYRLCGLPENFDGKLQAQRRDGGATAEVPVSQDESLLTLRSMSVAALPAIARGDEGGGKPAPLRGRARVFGKVVNANGAPVANARVQLMGGSAATLTRQNGDFVLDSLPAGTQALVVRQIGYRPTEVPVELSARTPARAVIRLGVFVPELTPVEIVSARDEGLQKVGFLDRKRTAAGGYFIDPDAVERRRAQLFTDLLRTAPGLRVSTINGQATVEPTRSAQGGCVTYWVDGAQWQSLEPGDLDSFVRPEEVAAVEIYHGSSIPAQFQTPGQGCSAVVVWTKTRVMKRGK